MAARMNRQGDLFQSLATLAVGTLVSSIARDEIDLRPLAIDFNRRAPAMNEARATGASARQPPHRLDD
jgi:hypothetical protein